MSFWDGFEKAAMKEVAKVAIIFEDDQTILMGKRNDSGKWTEPGGHLEKGEDAVAGAVREVKEETGLTVTPAMLRRNAMFSKVVTKPSGEKLRIHTFKAFFKGKKPETDSSGDPDNEVKKWQWIKMKGGLPAHVKSNLHVPAKHNMLLGGLGLTPSTEKLGSKKTMIRAFKHDFARAFVEGRNQYMQHHTGEILDRMEKRKREKKKAG